MASQIDLVMSIIFFLIGNFLVFIGWVCFTHKLVLHSIKIYGNTIGYLTLWKIKKQIALFSKSYFSNVEVMIRRQRPNTASWVSLNSLLVSNGWVASRKGPKRISTCGGFSCTAVNISVRGSYSRLSVVVKGPQATTICTGPVNKSNFLCNEEKYKKIILTHLCLL